MLRESGLLPMLQHHAISPTGQQLCVYGDPAYPLRVHLQAPFQQGVRFTPQMSAYNKSMDEVRVSVEWLFGDIANYFKFLDLKKKNSKIEQSSVCKIIYCIWYFKKCTYLPVWQSSLPVLWIGSTSHSGLLCMNFNSNIISVFPKPTFPSGHLKA